MKYKKGMTLVEMIVSLGILGVVMLFFTFSLKPLLRAYDTQNALSEKKDLANQIASVLKDRIHKETVGVAIADSNPDTSVYRACYYANGTTLTTSGGSVDEIPADLYSGKDVHVHFSSAGKNVLITIQTDGYELSLTVAPLNPDINVSVSGSAADNWLCVHGSQ